MRERVHSSELAQLLAANPVFAVASAGALQRLVQCAELRTFAPGEAVLVEGDPGEAVFVLLRGMVRVFHVSPGGDEVVLKVFRAPALFGEAEALSGLPYQEHVAALTDSAVLAIPPEALLAVLRAEAEVCVRMLVDVATRLAIASYNEKSLAFDPATVRLANYLLDYASWTSEAEGSEAQVELTQDDMAAAIGVSRRCIAKDVIAWQQEGLIERRGRRYVIVDAEGLRRYSDPGRLQLMYHLAGDAKDAADSH